jgi:4-aminobutyrate aminotransferase
MNFSDYSRFLSPALAKTTDLVIEGAHGCYLRDNKGDEYLDFVQGIAVNVFGHCYPRIVEAMKKQLDQVVNASFNLVNYPSTLELAKSIAGVAPGNLGVTFFSNSGAEANDGAIKLAKAHTHRPIIIAFRGSFHGRTIGATSVTGSNAKYRKYYEPLMGGVYFAPYPTPYRWGYRGVETDPDTCAEEALLELQRVFDYLAYPENVAAVIIEPVLGEGGYVVPPKKFLTGLREICSKHGILLIFDEVQSGYGRTGKMFAGEHFGVVPDIMTVGKAMAGGLPMSGIISTPEIMETWQPGMHGTTFGGNPVCAAAGVEVLKAIEEEHILENVNKQGAYLQGRLLELQKKYPVLGDVRGLGLMIAVEFINPADRSPNAGAFNKVRRFCLEHKLLILGCGVYGNGFRFATPLNIDKAALDKGLAILEQALNTL